MANYEQLKIAVRSVIKQNGRKEITGELLQQTLIAIINSLGATYQFGGVATPGMDPGTPDYRVAYLAGEVGEYPDFDGLEIQPGEIAMFLYSGDWEKQSISIPTQETIKQLTYFELLTLRDDGELTPGMRYRITDYVTTTRQEETRALAHQFDVIVLALSNNELSEFALAAHHAGDTYFADCNLAAWKLKYCIDNDTSRFFWADDDNGKGVIYYMKDEWGNECGYDFKNIQFLRYKKNQADVVINVEEANTDIVDMMTAWLEQSTRVFRYGFAYPYLYGEEITVDNPSQPIVEDAKYIALDDPEQRDNPAYVWVKLDENNAEWLFTFSPATGAIRDMSITTNYECADNQVFYKDDGGVCHLPNNIVFGASFGNKINGHDNTIIGSYVVLQEKCAYNDITGSYDQMGGGCDYNIIWDGEKIVFGSNNYALKIGAYGAAEECTFGNNNMLFCLVGISGCVFGNDNKLIYTHAPFFYSKVGNYNRSVRINAVGAGTIRYCEVLDGLHDKDISFTTNKNYNQIAGANSNGVVVVWNPADLI